MKRVEQKAINSWWAQTVEQCQQGKKPMLFYRANYQPWQAMVYLQDINDDLRGDYTCILSFLGATMLIRESL